MKITGLSTRSKARVLIISTPRYDNEFESYEETEAYLMYREHVERAKEQYAERIEFSFDNSEIGIVQILLINIVSVK